MRAGEYASALGAVVALVVALIHFWPQPDPPPQKLNATMSSVTVDKDVAWSDYLNAGGRLPEMRAELKAKGLTEREIAGLLAAPGLEVDFSLLIEGPPGRKLRLDTVVYRDGTRKRAPVSGIGERGGGFRSEAWHDGATARTWVAAPTKPGHYYIELTLYEDKSTGPRDVVRSVRTKPFTY